jgi:hypothetical protein
VLELAAIAGEVRRQLDELPEIVEWIPAGRMLSVLI